MRMHALAVWQQIPVANRTVEVNTKTGFGLVAGSYSVRGSSTQMGLVAVSAATSATLAISSVTVTRTTAWHTGSRVNTNLNDGTDSVVQLSSAVLVTVYKITAAGSVETGVSVVELV